MELIHVPDLPFRMDYRKSGTRQRPKVQGTVRDPISGATGGTIMYQEHIALLTRAGWNRASISPETPVPIELELDDQRNIRIRGVERPDGEFILMRDLPGLTRSEVYGI